MKQSHINKEQLSSYNIAVKQAHTNILKVAKQLLAQIEHEELRYTLIRDETSRATDGVILHEFVNPLLYLRLEIDSEGLYTIRYGFEMGNSNNQLSDRTASFTRAVYRLTSKDVTGVDIENCVSNS